MKKNFTIPNVISAIRILLIPVFVCLYFGSFINNTTYAFLVIVLSALSDIVDGYIARRFNMVSNLGKVLDPVADKLTQLAIVIVFCFKHNTLIPVFFVLFTKELLTTVAATLWFKKGLKPMSAKWWGKVSTAILYLSFIYYLLSDIFNYGNTIIDYVIATLSIVFLLFSMCGYIKTALTNTKQVTVN